MRNYRRISKRGEYGTEVLQLALQSIKKGVALMKVARQFGIPARTLRRHRDGKVNKPGELSLGRCSSIFPSEVEAELLEHIKLMERALFGLTTLDVRRLAYEMAERMNIDHPFNKQSMMAGIDWLKGFLHRHPSLSIREPQGTSLSRAIGFNRSNVNRFYDLLDEELEIKQYTAQQVWNMDETGLSTVQRPGKILAQKGKRQVGKMTSGEKGQTTTAICAMSSSGAYIPPVFVFKRKRMNDILMKGSPPGSVGVCSKTGWTDSEIFMKWLKHFVSCTHCSPDYPALIILDGHHSHKTLQAIDFAREHGITLLTLPPHSTHKLQPLDKSFFKALKCAYNMSTDSFLKCHPGKRVTAYDVAAIFAQAYGKCATVEKAMSGFAVTGIWPFQRDIFSDEDFEASHIAEYQSDAVYLASHSSSKILEKPKLSTSNRLDDHAYMTKIDTGVPLTGANSLSSNIDVQVELPPTESSVPATSLLDLPASAGHVVGDKSLDLSNDNCFMSTSTPCHPGLSKARQILAELSPRPKIKVLQNRKRKLETCAVITSSPYKLQLTVKQNSCKEKKRNKNVLETKKTVGTGNDMKKVTSSKNKTGKTKSRTKTVGTYNCLVCAEPYSDPPTEDWIQCAECQQWAHELCTGGSCSRGYVCDFCH